jgi:hypothetical protein
MLWAGQSAVQIPVGKTDLSLLQNVQTFSTNQNRAYSIDTEVISEGRAVGSSSYLFTSI